MHPFRLGAATDLIVSLCDRLLLLRETKGVLSKLIFICHLHSLLPLPKDQYVTIAKGDMVTGLGGKTAMPSMPPHKKTLLTA